MPSATSAKNMSSRAAAGTRDPRLGVDDDVVGIDLARFDKRNERQLRRGRIAAGIGHEPRIPDRVALDLGEAIDGFLLQIGCAMLVTIPFGISTDVVRGGNRPKDRRP